MGHLRNEGATEEIWLTTDTGLIDNLDGNLDGREIEEVGVTGSPQNKMLSPEAKND